MFFDSNFIIFHCTKEIWLARSSALVNTQRQAVCVVIDIFTKKLFKKPVKILQLQWTCQGLRSLPILIISWHLMGRLLRLKNKMAKAFGLISTDSKLWLAVWHGLTARMTQAWLYQGKICILSSVKLRFEQCFSVLNHCLYLILTLKKI